MLNTNVRRKMATMRRILVILLLAGLVFMPTAVNAQQSENDLLIDKMVEKGYLSPIEAEILKDKTKEYVGKHMNEGRLISLPKWVQRIELKGDIRLRYEYQRIKGLPVPTTESRTRGRLRVRVGILSRINNYLRTGVGIATSSDGDQRSTNITFDDSFDRADIRLDYAFLEFQPWQQVKVIGGKFKKDDYLWTPTQLLWDSDINPYGASAHLEHQLTRNLRVFANTGAWVIDEQSGSPEDQFMLYGQPGIHYDDFTFDAIASVNIYKFRHLKGFILEGTACTNSGLNFVFGSCTGGSLDNGFRNLGYSFEIGYRRMIQEEFYRIAVFGEYTENDWGPDKENDAWAAGMVLGNHKIKNMGDWQLQFTYARLERDAFPDVFPDSDRYSGATGVAGYSGSLKVGLAQNANLAFEIHRNERIRVGPGQEFPENLYQFDVNVKF